MIPSIVGSPPIFGGIDVRKFARTLFKMVVAPAMTSHAIVGINGRFVPWENLSNMLKS